MMIEIDIGPAPVNLNTAVGLAVDAQHTENWRIQVRDQAVYRTRSAGSPSTGAVRGFRHATGSTITVPVLGAGIDGMSTWLWTSTGSAVVFAEPAPE